MDVRSIVTTVHTAFSSPRDTRTGIGPRALSAQGEDFGRPGPRPARLPPARVRETRNSSAGAGHPVGARAGRRVDCKARPPPSLRRGRRSGSETSGCGRGSGPGPTSLPTRGRGRAAEWTSALRPGAAAGEGRRGPPKEGGLECPSRAASPRRVTAACSGRHPADSLTWTGRVPTPAAPHDPQPLYPAPFLTLHPYLSFLLPSSSVHLFFLFFLLPLFFLFLRRRCLLFGSPTPAGPDPPSRPRPSLLVTIQTTGSRHLRGTHPGLGREILKVQVTPSTPSLPRLGRHPKVLFYANSTPSSHPFLSLPVRTVFLGGRPSLTRWRRRKDYKILGEEGVVEVFDEGHLDEWSPPLTRHVRVSDPSPRPEIVQ